MNFSLLALDLDGTALLDDHRSFSPRLHAALAEAARRGVAIVPTTGRQHAVLPPAVHTGAAWENLCILCNGGEIRRLRTGELLAAHYLAPETIRTLLAVAGRLGLPVELSAGGLLYLTEESWAAQRKAATLLQFHLNSILSTRGRAVSDLEMVLRQPDLQVDKVNLPYIPKDKREAAAHALSAMAVSFAWSSPYSIEVTHVEATKAKGMLRVCQMLGVDPARTLAIGDSGNDLSMLRAAGLGVAMGNAPPEVRDQADAVTASYRADGAALAIERYLLGEGFPTQTNSTSEITRCNRI